MHSEQFRHLLVCKAVWDITFLEERFLHSLCYTLINLLKPARPVSCALIHQKSHAALNPTRIFSMDAGGKSAEPHSWQLSVRVFKNVQSRDKHTHYHCQWWMLGGDKINFNNRQMKQFMVISVLLALLFAIAMIWILHKYQWQIGNGHFLPLPLTVTARAVA